MSWDKKVSEVLKAAKKGEIVSGKFVNGEMKTSTKKSKEKK